MYVKCACQFKSELSITTRLNWPLIVKLVIRGIEWIFQTQFARGNLYDVVSERDFNPLVYTLDFDEQRSLTRANKKLQEKYLTYRRSVCSITWRPFSPHTELCRVSCCSNLVWLYRLSWLVITRCLTAAGNTSAETHLPPSLTYAAAADAVASLCRITPSNSLQCR